MVEFKEHSSGQLNDFFFFLRNNIIKRRKRKRTLKYTGHGQMVPFIITI